MGVHKMSEGELSELDRRNKTELTALKNEVRTLTRAVRGFNGSTGLIGHAEKTDLTLTRLENGQTDIKKLLIGDETKADDSGGLRGGQRDLRKMQSALVRFFWIVLGVLISGSAGLIFYTIQLRIATVSLSMP